MWLWKGASEDSDCDEKAFIFIYSVSLHNTRGINNYYSYDPVLSTATTVVAFMCYQYIPRYNHFDVSLTIIYSRTGMFIRSSLTLDDKLLSAVINIYNIVSQLFHSKYEANTFVDRLFRIQILLQLHNAR